MKKEVRDWKLEAEKSFARWNQIANEGAGDPFWPDGTNMNLVRNHIIYYYKQMDGENDTEQMSLFEVSEEDRRPIPPKVPDAYCVIGGKHGKFVEKERDIIWGKPGEYRA